MRLTSRILTSCAAVTLALSGLAMAAPAADAPASAGFPIPVPGGQLAGEVVEGGSGAPVANAPVMLSRKGVVIMIAVSDSSGVFDFGRLSPGSYTVSSGSASRNVSISSHAVFVTLATS